MQLEIIQFKTEKNWHDPLMNYMAHYIELINEDYVHDVFKDMDAAFTFLQKRMIEFVKANPNYCKPSSLNLTYSRPSCCPAKIRLSYLNQFITIKQFVKNETDPNISISQATGDDSQSHPSTSDSAQPG